MTDFSRIIREAYREILDREPDPGGLANWNSAMGAGLTEAQLREAFLRSEEYARNHPGGDVGGTRHDELLLRAAGNRFVRRDGAAVTLRGAIPCCSTEDGEANPEWPLASAAFRAHALEVGDVNFLHIRLGPWRAEATSDEWVRDLGGAYLEAGGDKVDLTQWNPAFWSKVDMLLADAGDAGQWVEVDVCDGWGIKHAKLGDFGPNWKYQPWLRHNNVQNEDWIAAAGTGAIAAGTVFEIWVRRVVETTGRHGNVIYQLGNENGLIPGFRPEWERSMAAIIRDTETRRSYGRHLIGTQSQLATLMNDPAIDYAEFHTNGGTVGSLAKPTGVNEYNPEPPLQAAAAHAHYCSAAASGVMYWLWRHTMTRAQWEQALDLVKRGCGGTPCPLPDFDAPGWTEVLPKPGSETVAALAAAESRVTAARTDLFTPGTNCLRSNTHDNILAALDAIAADMRAAGTCAWQHSDAIMARRPDANWEELHAMAFGNGCLLAPSNAYKRTFREPQSIG